MFSESFWIGRLYSNIKARIALGRSLLSVKNIWSLISSFTICISANSPWYVWSTLWKDHRFSEAVWCCFGFGMWYWNYWDFHHEKIAKCKGDWNINMWRSSWRCEEKWTKLWGALGKSWRPHKTNMLTSQRKKDNSNPWPTKSWIQ